MNSLDIQKWKLKYIHQINEVEDDEFNIEVGSWDNFSSEYQELEDKFGAQTASQLRDKFKDTYSSPKELNKALLNKENTWIEVFIDAIEDGDDVEDAWSMADMVQQDQDDIEKGLSKALEILEKNPKLKKYDEEEVLYMLWKQMNKEDDDYYENMDTDVRERLYDQVENMLSDWLN
jgi:hypothetical protein